MDDILVIILTLVVAAIGALGQRKKKTNNTQSGNVQNETSDFWDVIMGQEEQPIVQPVVEEEEPKKEEFVSTLPKRDYQFSSHTEGVSDIEEEVEKVKPTKRKVMIEGEEFSLKKAVIYHEILNRKYT